MMIQPKPFPSFPGTKQDKQDKQEVRKRLEELGKSGKECKVRNIQNVGFNIMTEKSVYQPGEEVVFSVYCYDKWSKRPEENLGTILKTPKLKVRIFDSGDNKVTDLTVSTKPSASAHSAVFHTSKQMSGGFYTAHALYSGVMMDSTKFFVTSIRERRNALILDLNKDALKAGDMVVGKVTLQLLTKGPQFLEPGNGGHVLQYALEITSNRGESLHSSQKKLTQGQGYFSFRVPAQLNNVKGLTFRVHLGMEGQDVMASRQLQVTSLKEMHVRFSPEGGRFVVGMKNRVYFSCYTKTDEKVTSQVTSAKLLMLIMGNHHISSEGEVVMSGISSDEEGRGVFEVELLKGKQYVFEVSRSGISRRFPIYSQKNLDKDYEKMFSKVQMRVEKRVLKSGEALKGSVTKCKNILGTKFDVILMDKLKVLAEKKLLVEKSEEEVEFILELDEKTTKQGGVFTLQLYKELAFGSPMQEILVYVEPKQRLDIGLNLGQEKYCPGDTVNFKVAIGHPGIVAVSVSDETAFLEVERRRRPASFATKTFLEKEVLSKSKELACADQYIDWFFENTKSFIRASLETKEEDRKAEMECLKAKKRETLERLLGVQDWRLMFLTDSCLKKHVDKAKSDSEEDKARNYLLPVQKETLKNIFKPPTSDLFDMFFGGPRRVEGMRMQMGAMGGGFGGFKNFAAPQMMAMASPQAFNVVSPSTTSNQHLNILEDM